MSNRPIAILLSTCVWGAGLFGLPLMDVVRAPGINNKGPVINAEAKTVRPGIPDKLLIPAIGLEAKILMVGLTGENIVDVPVREVGWYENGPRPGETGNSVLDGHFKQADFSSGVFGNLTDVSAGNDIFTIDREGRKFHFTVIEKEEVKVKDFDTQKIYGDADKPKLNLITCAGKYDMGRKDFTRRTIVYAQLTD
jgi:sortase A